MAFLTLISFMSIMVWSDSAYPVHVDVVIRAAEEADCGSCATMARKSYISWGKERNDQMEAGLAEFL